MTSVMTAQRTFGRNQAGLFQATTRLATGRRINSGKDGPAGLISSEQLAAELKSLEAQTRSLQRANSFARISDGHTGELSSLMSELNGLVIASANQAGMTDGEIAANQMQIDNLVSSIERVGGNAITSLDGFHMPDSGNAAVEKRISDATASVSSLRTGGTNSLASGNFEAAQAAIQGAIDNATTASGHIGSYQRNNLEPGIRSNQITYENLAASRSRIADADYASETSNLIRFSILSSANLQVLQIAQQQRQ